MTFHRIASYKKSSFQLWFVCCFLSLLLFTACSTEQSASTPSSPAIQRPAQETSPGPSPVATLLALAPRNCPASPSPGFKAFSEGGTSASGTGSGPVWEDGLPANATLHLNDQGYTQWPLTKLTWPIGPDFPRFVTVRVKNLTTGTEAWWDVGDERGGTGAPPPRKPVRPLILDKTGNRDVGMGQHDWGTLLYLPRAGCYSMEANWLGGQWRLLFTVGR